MKIQNARAVDKKVVFDFCKSTFSWGDYIHDVWDHWMSEGNLFVLRDGKSAVAVCHAFIIDSSKQVWIEGIRVNPNYRRKGYAKKLVTHCEYVAKKYGCKTSCMLIESTNFKSLNLATNLNYSKSELWDFYSLSPKKILSNNMMHTPTSSLIKKFLSDTKYYVQSWRWIPLVESEISFLVNNKKIFASKNNDVLDSLLTVIESEHFDNTILVTLLYVANRGFEKIFSFLQNIGYEQGQRIQILTKIKNIPNYPSLDRRLSFYLMRKSLV